MRQVERLVQKMTSEREPKPVEDVDPMSSLPYRSSSAYLERRVRITGRPDRRGRIEIEFYSGDDLHRLYSTILGEQN